jgi:hypothetical protein
MRRDATTTDERVTIIAIARRLRPRLGRDPTGCLTGTAPIIPTALLHERQAWPH